MTTTTKTQTCKILNSRKYGPVTYIRTVNEFRQQRLLRTSQRILRSQSTISRSRYADYCAKGGFFRAGDFVRLIWIA